MRYRCSRGPSHATSNDEGAQIVSQWEQVQPNLQTALVMITYVSHCSQSMTALLTQWPNIHVETVRCAVLRQPVTIWSGSKKKQRWEYAAIVAYGDGADLVLHSHIFQC